MAHRIRSAAVLALLAVPILEIGVLIRAGQLMGFWKLMLVVIATAMLGSAVIRRTGLAVITKARQQFDAGGRGFDPLVDGLLQITAGLLLILPGLISDCVGLVLLVPAVRAALIARVLPRFSTISPDEAAFQTRPPNEDGGPDGPFDASRDETMSEGVVIEGEYERVTEETVPERRDVSLRPPIRRASK